MICIPNLHQKWVVGKNKSQPGLREKILKLGTKILCLEMRGLKSSFS